MIEELIAILSDEVSEKLCNNELSKAQIVDDVMRSLEEWERTYSHFDSLQIVRWVVDSIKISIMSEFAKFDGENWLVDRQQTLRELEGMRKTLVDSILDQCSHLSQADLISLQRIKPKGPPRTSQKYFNGFNFDLDNLAPFGMLGEILDDFAANRIPQAITALLSFDCEDLLEHPQWPDLMTQIEGVVVGDYDCAVQDSLCILLVRFLQAFRNTFQQDDVLKVTFAFFARRVILSSSEEITFSITLGNETFKSVYVAKLLELCILELSHSATHSNSEGYEAYLQSCFYLLTTAINHGGDSFRPILIPSVVRRLTSALKAFRKTAVYIVALESNFIFYIFQTIQHMSLWIRRSEPQYLLMYTNIHVCLVNLAMSLLNTVPYSRLPEILGQIGLALSAEGLSIGKRVWKPLSRLVPLPNTNKVFSHNSGCELLAAPDQSPHYNEPPWLINLHREVCRSVEYLFSCGTDGNQVIWLDLLSYQQCLLSSLSFGSSGLHIALSVASMGLNATKTNDVRLFVCLTDDIFDHLLRMGDGELLGSVDEIVFSQLKSIISVLLCVDLPSSASCHTLQKSVMMAASVLLRFQEVLPSYRTLVNQQFVINALEAVNVNHTTPGQLGYLQILVETVLSTFVAFAVSSEIQAAMLSFVFCACGTLLDEFSHYLHSHYSIRTVNILVKLRVVGIVFPVQLLKRMEILVHDAVKHSSILMSSADDALVGEDNDMVWSVRQWLAAHAFFRHNLDSALDDDVISYFDGLDEHFSLISRVAENIKETRSLSVTDPTALTDSTSSALSEFSDILTSSLQPNTAVDLDMSPLDSSASQLPDNVVATLDRILPKPISFYGKAVLPHILHRHNETLNWCVISALCSVVHVQDSALDIRWYAAVIAHVMKPASVWNISRIVSSDPAISAILTEIDCPLELITFYIAQSWFLPHLTWEEVVVLSGLLPNITSSLELVSLLIAAMAREIIPLVRNFRGVETVFRRIFTFRTSIVSLISSAKTILNDEDARKFLREPL